MKRILSLIMALALVLTCFVGASAEVVSKGENTKLVRFTPAVEEFTVEDGETWNDKVIGKFSTDDGGVFSEAELADLKNHIKVSQVAGYAYTMDFSIAPDGTLMADTYGAFGSTTAIRIQRTGTSSVLDYSQLGTVNIPVKVVVFATGLSAISGSATLYIGDAATTLSTVVTPDDATNYNKVEWTTSDEKIVALGATSYQNTGSNWNPTHTNRVEISPVAEGKATITATVDDVKREVEVTVKPVLPTNVTLASSTANYGEKKQLELVWTGDAGTREVTDKTGTWSIKEQFNSEGEPVTSATIDADGMLTTAEEGKITVCFEANAKKPDGTALKLEQVVTVSGAPTAQAFVTAEYTNEGKSETYEATWTGSGAKTIDAQSPVTITLDTNKVAGATFTYQIDSDDKAAYNGPFTVSKDCDVAVFVDDVKKGTFTINYTEIIEGIELAADTTDINGTDAAKLTVKVTGTTTASKNIEWKLEPADAKFTAKPADNTMELSVKALAGAKDGDKVTYTVTDTVSKKTSSVELTYHEVHLEGITLNKTDAVVANNEHLVLTAVVTPANCSDAITYSWESSNTAVIAKPSDTDNSVDIRPVSGKEGVSTIKVTATVGSVNMNAQCVVTATPAATKMADPVFTVVDNANGSANVTISTAYAGTRARIYYRITTDGTPASWQYSNNNSVNLPTLAVGHDYKIEAYASHRDGNLETSNTVTLEKSTKVAATGIVIKNVPEDKTIKLVGTNAYTTPVIKAEVQPTTPAVTDGTYTWSYDDSIITVVTNTNNEITSITAKAVGTTQVTATSKDGAFTDSFTVVVEDAKPATVAITATTPIECGTWDTVSAAVKDEGGLPTLNQKVAWKSNNEAVLTIDENGKITALAEGTATITATAEGTDKAGNAVYAEKLMTVSKAGIYVMPVEFSYTDAVQTTPAAITGTLELASQIIMETKTTGAEIYYTTDGSTPTKEKGTLYAGPITLDADGTTNFKAIAYAEGKTSLAAASKSVTIALKVTKIVLDKTEVSLEVGEEVKVAVSFEPANVAVAKQDLQSVTDSKVDVAFDKATKIITLKGKAVGKTELEFKDVNNKASVKLPVEVKQISDINVELVEGSAIEMNIGDSKALHAIVNPADKLSGATVVWSMSDEDKAKDIAVVDNNGVVTARNAGTVSAVATYTDSTNEKYTASIAITVNADPATAPAQPAKMLSFEAADEGSFSAVEGTKFVKVIGKLAAGEGETWDQITYYYNVSIIGGGSGINYSIDGEGNVTMIIPKVTADVTENLSWKLTWKTIRGTAGSLNGQARAFGAPIKLTVTKKPTAIDNTLVTFTEPQNMTAEGIVLGKINNSEAFVATDTKVTLTPSVEGFKAEINANGEIVLTADGAAAGEYEVVVTISAEGCPDIKTNPVTVIVDNPAPIEKGFVMENGYQDAKGVWHVSLTNPNAKIAYNGGTATFALKKASMAKKLTLNADGTMTALKKGTVTLVATVDGVAQNVKVKIEKKAFADPSKITLQYKDGKEWKNVADHTGVFGIPAKKSLKLKLVGDGGLMIIKGATFEPAIAGVTCKAKASTAIKTKKSSAGESTLTIEVNGVEFDVDFITGSNVAASFVIEPEIEAIEVIEEIEIEEIDE